MKQTAVEWLEEQFEESYSYINEIFKDTFEQAKEMEKQQMEDVWDDSRVEDFGDDYIGKQTSFNDYFNETFNTKEKCTK